MWQVEPMLAEVRAYRLRERREMLAQRQQCVRSIGSRAMQAGGEDAERDGGLIVVARTDGITQRAAIKPFHEDGVAMRVKDGGGTLAAVPVQELRAEALLAGSIGLEDFQHGKVTAILLDPEQPAATAFGKRRRLGQRPADHGATERGFDR